MATRKTDMFLLRCPRCKETMKYQPRESMRSSKSKRCVYCGRSFKATENIVRKNI